jgi:hypothetical protein
VKAASLFGLALSLSLVCVTGAYAEGKYQRTKDGKTMVWNNDPTPNDVAIWSGKRDANGYATGNGTLTWMTRIRAFSTGSNIAGERLSKVASYTGTMTRGKLNGPGTAVDSKGRIFHGTFVDGKQQHDWKQGPLVAKAEETETAEKAERAEPATSTSAAPVPKSSTAKKVAEETDVPAAGPAESEVQESEIAKPKTTDAEKPATSEKAASPPLIAQTSTAETDQSSTQREPVTRNAALAPGAVRAIDRPTRATTKKSETESAKQNAKSERIEKATKVEKPAPSQPTEGADTQLSEDVPAEGPLQKQEPAPRPTPNIEHLAPQTTQPDVSQPSADASPARTNPQPSEKDTPADDSIQSLTGPPKSLHLNQPPPPETNPPTQIPTAAPEAASPPAASTGPKLTAVNATDIADIEARTKGFDLGDYQLPKAEYNATNDSWSVTYVPRGSADSEKKLNITIQDKNGKAEVKK